MKTEPIRFTTKEVWDLIEALRRAHEDLSYEASFLGSFEEDEMPAVEDILDRWRTLEGGLLCIAELQQEA